MVKNAGLIVFGSLIIAVSTGMFLVPGNIINGGLSGIAIILKAVWQIPVDITVGILSIFLFILGWIILGKKFSFNTMISTIVYPIALSFILRVIRKIRSDLMPANDMHLLLAAIFGGALLGLGVALTFLAGVPPAGRCPCIYLQKIF
jgi:uncharacterized membrane-anchored protein YitT (DUF2179 family)